MFDTKLLVKGQNETQEQFNRRIYNLVDHNMVEVSKRIHGETAENHYIRFEEYEYSHDAAYIFDPRDGESFDDPMFRLRGSLFMATKKKIMDQWTDEIFDRMREKRGVSLEDWLKEVDKVLAKYEPIINELRDDFNETYGEAEARKNKFRDHRNEILIRMKSEAATADLKEKYNNKVALARDVELEKNKVRKEALDEEIKEEEEGRKISIKEKKDKAKYKVFVMTMFGILLFYFVSHYNTWKQYSMWVDNGYLFWVILISSGISFLFLLSDSVYEWINDFFLYRAIMAILFFIISVGNKKCY